MTVWDYAAFGAAVATVLWYIWMVSRGNEERRVEDEAREFFDRHGRWPDEDGAGPASSR